MFVLVVVSALRHNGLRGTHSAQEIVQLNKMKVTILPALSDNYMYLVSKNYLILNPLEYNAIPLNDSQIYHT